MHKHFKYITSTDHQQSFEVGTVTSLKKGKNKDLRFSLSKTSKLFKSVGGKDRVLGGFYSIPHPVSPVNIQPQRILKETLHLQRRINCKPGQMVKHLEVIELFQEHKKILSVTKYITVI